MSAALPVTAEGPPLGRRTVMTQRWDELVYLHWAYDPAVIQAHLPDGVRVDTFDGAAWIGLIPFEMRRIAFPPTPSVPWLGSFVEVNVRTYVVDERGRRAVWFLSLDIPRTVPILVARSAFGLPYCWAATGHTTSAGGRPGDPARSGAGVRHRYEVRRRRPGPAPGALGVIDIEIGDEHPEDEQTPFEIWSSARWGLVTTTRGRVRHGAVTHERWPLRRATLHDVDTGLVVAAGLPAPEGDPVVGYSPGVQVDLAWLEPPTSPRGGSR